MNEEKDFWSAPDDHSMAKIRIVSKYFQVWTGIIGNNFKRMIYLDLYAGRGKYNNGSLSTPLLNLSHAVNDELCHQKLYAFLNDADKENARNTEEKRRRTQRNQKA